MSSHFEWPLFFLVIVSFWRPLGWRDGTSCFWVCLWICLGQSLCREVKAILNEWQCLPDCVLDGMESRRSRTEPAVHSHCPFLARSLFHCRSLWTSDSRFFLLRMRAHARSLLESLHLWTGSAYCLWGIRAAICFLGSLSASNMK